MPYPTFSIPGHIQSFTHFCAFLPTTPPAWQAFSLHPQMSKSWASPNAQVPVTTEDFFFKSLEFHCTSTLLGVLRKGYVFFICSFKSLIQDCFLLLYLWLFLLWVVFLFCFFFPVPSFRNISCRYVRCPLPLSLIFLIIMLISLSFLTLSYVISSLSTLSLSLFSAVFILYFCF